MFDEEFSLVFSTKYLQIIITSVSAKMTHLLLTSQENLCFNQDKPKRDTTDRLIILAKEIITFLKDLSYSYNKVIKKKFFDDLSAVQEIDEATQNLIISAQNMLMCSQMLSSLVNSKDLSESERGIFNGFVSSVSKVYQSFTILLMCMENAETRCIIKLAQKTQQQTATLIVSDSFNSFKSKFESFTQISSDFYSKMNIRCKDLLDSRVKAKMSKYLHQFKYSISVLITSFTISMKYPLNEEAQNSKDFAYNQITNSVNCLIKILQARCFSNDLVVKSFPGLYFRVTSSIEQVLSIGRRENLEDDIELMTKLHLLLHFYVKLITVIKKKINCKTTIKLSQKLIEDIKILLDHSSKLSAINQSFSKNRKKYLDDLAIDEYCRETRTHLKKLFSNVKLIVMSYFTEVFTVTTQPLDYVKSTSGTEKFKLALEAFSKHASNIHEVCKFVENFCESSENKNEIRSSLDSFLKISSTLSKTTNNEVNFNEVVGQNWIKILDKLFEDCIFGLDLVTLLGLIIRNIKRYFGCIQTNLVDLNESLLTKNVMNMIGTCGLLTRISKREIKVSADVNKRTMLLDTVKTVDNAIIVTLAASNYLLNDSGELNSHDDFLKSCLILKDEAVYLENIILDLDNINMKNQKITHSIRDFSNSLQIVSMVHEISSLGSSLSKANILRQQMSSILNFNDINDVCDVKNEVERVDMLMVTSGEPVTNFEGDEKNEATHKRLTDKPSFVLLKNSEEIDKKIKLKFLIDLILAIEKKDDKRGESLLRSIEILTDDIVFFHKELIKYSGSKIAQKTYDVMKTNIRNLQCSTATLQVSVEMKSLSQVTLRALDWQQCAKKTMRKLSKVFSKFHQLVILENEDVITETNVIYRLVNDVAQLNVNDVTVSELNKSLRNIQEEVLKYTNRIRTNDKVEDNENVEYRAKQNSIYCYLLSLKHNGIKHVINTLVEFCIKENFFEFPWPIFVKHVKKSNLRQRLSEYITRITSLFQKTSEIIKNYIQSSNFMQENILIVKKSHTNYEVTKRSIEEVISFILNNQTESNFSYNGRVVYRFEFLHFRFMLETCRLFSFISKVKFLHSMLKNSSKSTDCSEIQTSDESKKQINELVKFISN